MGMMSRNKGKTGEREVAALIRDLTGWDARRRVRQHEGDSDLLGVPGWAIEVKRRRIARRSEVAAWWRQTVSQAGGELPLLLYRHDRGEWRAVWPLAILLTQELGDSWTDFNWTADSPVAAWAAVSRERSATSAGEDLGSISPVSAPVSALVNTNQTASVTTKAVGAALVEVELSRTFQDVSKTGALVNKAVVTSAVNSETVVSERETDEAGAHAITGIEGRLVRSEYAAYRTLAYQLVGAPKHEGRPVNVLAGRCQTPIAAAA